uniref:Ribosomal protein L20 n=1 Tax=Gracilaria firma TaxID=2510791 RepID=A0A1W6C6X9_9FLOR|nr:ribosomal protein L20 [Gracilaria changii]ARJ60485.1 ribosomal protein L20 [Gracilaria changii]ART65154.1 ribosomal protein L20 [Gracilaria changii]
MRKKFFKIKPKSCINKKRIFQKKNINHIKLPVFKYNLFSFFISTENIVSNKKILAELITTEIGAVFSLMRWGSSFYARINWDS